MLHNGLYEQIINKGLDSELASSDKLCQTAPIDSGESSKVLAKYITEIIEKGLDNVRDNGGDLSAQVDLVNKIVTTIMTETKEADFDERRTRGPEGQGDGSLSCFLPKPVIE